MLFAASNLDVMPSARQVGLHTGPLQLLAVLQVHGG